MVPMGLDSTEWHSMSDERRAQFMREKRKREAFKTEMCKGFIRTGICRYGDDCRFAHDQNELRLRPTHPKYKTELCLNFSKSGHCGYGSRCQFIHRSPDSQLRSRSTSGGMTNYSTPPLTMLDFTRSLQPPHHASLMPNRRLPSSSMPSTRFAMSAYFPRNCHSIFEPRMKEERMPLDRDYSIDNFLSTLVSDNETTLNGNSNSGLSFEVENLFPDFDKWHPFMDRQLFSEDASLHAMPTNGINALHHRNVPPTS